MSSNKGGFQLPDFNIDINKLSPAYGIPSRKGNSDPDYIPHSSRGRDIYGRLSFNSGLCWLSGFGAGGAYGFYEGWKSAASPKLKIRINSVINGVSRRGSMVGNSLGVIAFMHTAFVWASDTLELEHIFGSQVVTPLISGFMTGGIYKMTRGPRAAALAATIGSAVSCAYWYGGSYIYINILGKGGRYN